MTTRYRIGFDIGGTFTDFILLDTERHEIRLHKCLTTPHDPSVGALEGLTELLSAAGLSFADIGDAVHGTTLVTNTLIERTGARLGLITTRGLPRHPGDGHRATLRHLRPVPAIPRTAGAAPPPP